MRETYCMSNPKPYMILKYCAQSLAHKCLSSLVQIHLFLGQVKKENSKKEKHLRAHLNGVAEGVFNQITHGWHFY